MRMGRTWKAEWREFADPISGAPVKQLTNYMGHSHHLYFTNPGWYDNGRKLLFGSDRENRTNLYGFDLIVGDAGRVVRIWKRRGDRFKGPHVLAEHRSSMHIQKVHVHPRFTPDGTHVLYTSDCTGYGNLYLVKVMPFDALPPLKRD